MTFLRPLGSWGQLVDADATSATRNLFYNLQKVAHGNLLFGHEDALAYGLNADGTCWISEEARSDVKSVTGSHPAVYGWDIGRLELADSAANIDDVNFAQMKSWIIEGYERGGVITISWHANNPANGGDTWNMGERPVSKIIPGGSLHEFYKTWLDRVADFALDLKDGNGQYVPVIFRPYHEHTGSWFWWGRDHCTKDEYIALWRFTVEYLRDQRGIHHFLYSYSPSNVGVVNETNYLDRYPGDDYVDVLGTDDYGNVFNDNQRAAFLRNLRIAVNLANERGKVAALTETGLERIPDEDWFSNRVVNPIKEDSIARQLSYFLVWRNGRPDHFYAPYPGHPAADDLRSIYDDPFVLFEDQLPEFYKQIDLDILRQLPDAVIEANSEPLTYDLSAYFSSTESLHYEVNAEDESLIDVSVEEHVLSMKALGGPGQSLIRVNAFNPSGQRLSMSFYVTMELPEVVLDTSELNNPLVYPNPASEYLQVSHSTKLIEPRLYDVHGKRISSF